jgi:2-hydroxy-6-oxonona-2,4-dienedioate hydrolase
MESLNWNKKFVEIPPGETIAYSILGEGPEDLVMIHGMWVNLQSFGPIVPLLTNRFRMILIDLRGHGMSTYNHRVESNDDLVEDIHHVLEALNVKEFYMLGQSSGSIWCLRYAALYPEQVEKLILVSPLPLIGPPLYKKDKATGRKRLARCKEDYASTKKCKELYKLQQSGDTKVTIDGFLETCYNGPRKPSQEQLEVLALSNNECKNFEDFRWINNIYNYTDKKGHWGPGDGSVLKIKCPVLITMGDLDLFVTKDETKDYAEYLKGKVTFILYPEVGHLYFEIYDKKFVEDLISFIETPMRPRPSL